MLAQGAWAPRWACEVASGDARFERDGLAHGAGEPREDEGVVGARPDAGRGFGGLGFVGLSVGRAFLGRRGLSGRARRLPPRKQRLFRRGAGERHAKLPQLAHHAQVPRPALLLRLGGREG